jgi:hypothetical protein
MTAAFPHQLMRRYSVELVQIRAATYEGPGAAPCALGSEA